MNEKIIQDYFKDELIIMISSTLNKKVLSTKHTSTGRTIISQWLAEGLIDDNREGVEKWNRYSIVEIIWIGMIEQLRSYGIGRDKIKMVKRQLLYKMKDIDSPYPLFEFFIIRSVIFKRPSYVVINQDGQTSVMSSEEYVRNIKVGNYPGHILISLTQIYSMLIKKLETSKMIFSELFSKSQEELELMAFIHENNFSEIKIKLSNGKIERFEGSEQVSTKQRIIDLLKDNQYQDIELKQQQGKIVSITRKVKKKL